MNHHELLPAVWPLAEQCLATGGGHLGVPIKSHDTRSEQALCPILDPARSGGDALSLENGSIPGVPMKAQSIGIRRFQPQDAQPLFLATRESMAQIRRWMVWCREDYALSDSVAFIKSTEQDWTEDKRYSFAIYNQVDGAVLGSIGLSGVDRLHRLANIGYWVRSTWTGQGVGLAALRLTARVAFDELDFNRLEMLIATTNRRSIRVAEKAGACREGVLRQKLWIQGRPLDAALYSLLAEEYRGD